MRYGFICLPILQLTFFFVFAKININSSCVCNFLNFGGILRFLWISKAIDVRFIEFVFVLLCVNFVFVYIICVFLLLSSNVSHLMWHHEKWKKKHNNKCTGKTNLKANRSQTNKQFGIQRHRKRAKNNDKELLCIHTHICDKHHTVLCVYDCALTSSI